ncbi:MAG: tetratricopeptide repeat protein [Gemmatimonadaceae bacterium]
MPKTILFVVLVLIPSSVSFAQAPAAPAAAPPSATRQAANAAWNSRDWPRAAETYSALVKEDTTGGQPYFRLAVALTELGRYAEARQNLAVAARKGAPPPQVAYRRALIEAGENRLDSAFAQLKRATDAGLGGVPNPGDSLPLMQKLKRDPRYAAFTTALDRNARPCMHDDKYKEFDFWLGTWDVRPRGQIGGPAGRNVITKIENGCVVHESWSTPSGTGQSYNIWDATRHKWFQYWVDSGGGLHEYSGTLRDGAMRYDGSMPAGPASPGRVTFRVTFTPQGPDGLRQLGERLQADGSWVTAYDLIYERVTP